MIANIRGHLTGFFGDRRGQIAVIAAICAPVMIAGAGIGAESGYWYFQQRVAQMSADVSAFAGAVEARSGQPLEVISATALAEAERHGYRPARGGIEVNNPPLSGANRNIRSVEVIIQQTHPRHFSRMFLDRDITFTVRAVARFDEPGPACLLALDPAGEQSLLFSGSTDVTLAGCDLMSNSINTQALAITGSGQVITSCANSVGGMNISGQLDLTDCLEPRLNMPPALDPLADLVPPIAGGCRNLPAGGGGGLRTISPGRYCNGMTFNGDVHLEPGVYIVDGGAFRLNGGAHVTGDDVTIYLTNNATVQMNGNADIFLSAPETGEYAGVLFWGDRDNAANTTAQFNGTAASSLKGALYFPSQTLNIRGNFSGSDGCMRIIAYRVEMSGNSSLNINCSRSGMVSMQTPGFVRLVE
ncbi:pilus assembly protein TadG-related protein [Glycocaulis sp.]|uniref:pilus assembly protein TadG-related protein n=1 Tax=Glycocaulis sp. TaxID=1969725 RepID=UPI003D213355